MTITEQDSGSVPLATRKWEAYARERALMSPPVEAAVRAGYDGRSGAHSKLERKAAIRSRIAWLSKQEAEVLAEKRRRLEEFLWLALDTDPSEFWDDGQRLMKFAALDRQHRKLIEGLTYTEKGKPNLKLVQKAWAHAELRKMLGTDAPTKQELSGKDGASLAPTIILRGKPGAPDGEEN